MSVVIPGLPEDATAVSINVTATDGTEGSFLTVYPTGDVRPLTSTLNWDSAGAVANLADVVVYADHSVTLYNQKGTVNVVIDVLGFYSPSPIGSGAEGAPGINGTDGVDGINGTNGVDGINGTNGVDSAPGAPGAPGRGVNSFRIGDAFYYPIAGTPTFGSYTYVSPSSNAANKAAAGGWANYSIATADGVSTITYTSTRGFLSCFETRINGEANTVVGANPLPAIKDGRWVQNCVSNSVQTRTVAGAKLIEVRMVYGAEGTERFNWEVNIIS